VNVPHNKKRIMQKPPKPPKKPKYTLEELLEDMREEHLHGEIDFGPPVGKEVIEA